MAPAAITIDRQNGSGQSGRSPNIRVDHAAQQARYALPITTYAAGAEIYAPGEITGRLHEVQFGAVRLCRLLNDGRRQVVAFYLAGETFGFEIGASHRFFAEAVVATGVKSFGAGLGSTHAEDRWLMTLALETMTRAQDHLAVVGRQTAVERIAGFIVDLSNRQGGLDQVDLPMSRLDIADYLGLTIETVSRVFAKLKASGLVNLPSVRSIEIRDHAAMRSLCA